MHSRFLPSIILAMACVVAAGAAESAANLQGAKGMFYEQLQRPAEKLNNGLQYWIELKRSGKVQRVSNKFAFRSGDQIRFHVRSNADAFGYVVLREGSRGEHSVLFPDSRYADNNKLKANVEYSVPNDSYIEFDQFPGTEKVTLVMARNEVQPNRFMPDTFRDKVIVASRLDGSKDLVPGSFVVSYGNLPSTGTRLQNIKTPDTTTTPMHTTTPATNDLLVNTGHTTTSPIHAVAPNTILSPNTMVTPAKEDDGDAIITVVQKNPSDALAIEICLEHKP